MDKPMIQQAEQYIRKRAHRKAWKRILTGMSAVVVFVTTYSLILPAITMEQVATCGMEEHQQCALCYEPGQPEQVSVELICEHEIHSHTEECYDMDGSLVCGLADCLIHTHNELCYFDDKLICPLPEAEEHIHGEECYATGDRLICEQEEDYHVHDEYCCRTEQGAQICGQEESEDHTHGEACFEQVQTLICEVPENPEGHVHMPGCYESCREFVCTKEQIAVHSHDKECRDEFGILTCDILSAEEHVHTEDCLHISVCAATEDVLICPFEEHVHTESCMEYPIRLEIAGTENHQHDESCYSTVLVCGITSESDGPETEPEDGSVLTNSDVHEHGEACYETILTCEIQEDGQILDPQPNPEADLETASDWENTFRDVELSGVGSEDLLAIAISQLGYEESQENYIVEEDGVTKSGYTRYGAWYGEPYARWEIMFISFCAEYAGVDVIPRVSDVEDLIDALPDLYWDADDYTPTSGDLVFIDADDDGMADHAGIVKDCALSDMTIQVIAGDADDQVQCITYNMAGSGIIGYAQLSQVEADDAIGIYSNINVNGTKMYSPAEYITYQGSAHVLSGYYSNQYYPNTYVLIPEDYAPYAASMREWAIPMPWTASDGAAGMNYVVAYRADRDTDVSEAGEWYTTQSIWNSDYADCAELLAGIVQHSYPFITAEEMRAELEAAYEAGEISIDLSCCTESDYIAAVQWAIWDATGKSEPQKYVSGSTFPDYNTNGTLNPLSDPGHTNDQDVQEHVEAIRDWLMTQTASGDLEIEGHESVIQKSEDGTYEIETTVTLGRALEQREDLLVTFSAGDRTAVSNVSGEGTSEFTVFLDGLTAEEVLNAQVSLEVYFEHMQVYVYDSEDYQDMISGQWGEDIYELSFTVDVETTSVDVTKYWSNHKIGAEYIEVQLYADGEKCGEPVRLSESNGWAYTWGDLLKYSAPGVKIDYTIEEILVPGYLTSITKDESGSRIITTIEPVSLFEEGESYIFTYEGSADEGTSALGDETGNGGTGLYWVRNLNVMDADSIPDNILWTACGVSSDGTNAYLRNNATGNYLSYDGTYITLSSSASEKAYFLYDHFYFLNSSNYNQYLIYLNDGVGYTDSDWDSALAVTSCRYIQVERTTADINFLITNTKTDEDTSIGVIKKWSGRQDGNYPDHTEIQLLQNGAPYGPSVTMSEENGWYYRWEELPLKLGDTQYTYSVEEVLIEDYTVTVQPAVDGDGTLVFEVTNTWTPEYVPLILSKVDAANLSKLLPGAQFRLYLVSEEGEGNAVPIPGCTDGVSGVLLETITIGGDGTFRIEQLGVGKTYYLVETRAPKGYNSLDAPIQFTVEKDEDGRAVVTILSGETWTLVSQKDDDLLLQIKNRKMYVLPETGGSGAHLYTIGGLLLITAAIAFLLYYYKPRRKEDINTS